MKKMPTYAAAVLVVAAILPVVGTGAAAASDDEVIRRGQCSGSTDWKIKAKPEDGGLEVEGEIDSNRSGQSWRWVLRHNGDIIDRGRSVTGGRSGSFEVERRTRNAAGVDTFRFRATHAGEVCVARVRY